LNGSGALTNQLDSNQSKTADQAAQLKKLSTAQSKSQKTAKSAADLAEKHRIEAETAERKLQNEAGLHFFCRLPSAALVALCEK
jgi:hypothetical protein